MHRLTFRAAAVLAATTLIGAAAGAQGIGLSVGTLVPQGDLADGAKSGFVGIASLELGGRTALRVEGLWANSDLKGVVIHDANGVPLPESARVSGDVKLIGGMASLVFHLASGPIQPYLLGGGGYYNRSVAQDATDAASEFRHLSLKESKVGVHFGAGVKIAIIGIAIFGEARYHTVSTESSKTNFVPITIGVRL